MKTIFLNFKKAAALALAALMLLSVSGCGSYKSSSVKTLKAEELTAGAGAGEGDTKDVGIDGVFVGGAAEFAIELLKNSVDGKDNSMVSPLSVLLALSMTANGAKGETLRQMEKTLCGGISIDELNRYCKSYAGQLPDTQKTRFSIANSIWIKDGFDVREDFLKTNHSFYNASVYEAAFDESTVNDINKWVYDKTQKMIDGVIEEIGEDAVMYLINAIAFEAEWQKVYEEGQTRKNSFTEEGGSRYDVDMMFSKEDIYIEDKNATGFVKNYLDGYAFVALRPKDGVTLDEYIKSLSGEGFLKMLENKKGGAVYAGLPKFESEYSLDMKDILSEMGMPEAFDRKTADFSGMNASVQLYINSVIHKTYIKVDERGTKAGAVTSVEMDCEGAALEYYEVTLDRPFVYAIVDTQNNLPVFIGAVRTLD